MGQSIFYILDLPGRELNEQLDECDKASENDIELFTKEQALWEGRLPGSIDFAFNLSGDSVVVTMPIKYRVLSGEKTEALDLVNDWESKVRNLFPNNRVIRMHESLYNEMSSEKGWDWFTTTEFDEIEGWIEDKDREYWSYV